MRLSGISPATVVLPCVIVISSVISLYFLITAGLTVPRKQYLSLAPRVFNKILHLDGISFPETLTQKSSSTTSKPVIGLDPSQWNTFLGAFGVHRLNVEAEVMFQQLDTDSNGLLDALEIKNGIVNAVDVLKDTQRRRIYDQNIGLKDGWIGWHLVK